MKRISAFVFGLAVLLLYGCGAAKPLSKAYSACVEYTDSTVVVKDNRGKQMSVFLERQEGSVTTPVDTLSLVSLEGVQYCHFSYLSGSGAESQFVQSMFALEQGTAESLVFSGKNLSGSTETFRIEGYSNQNMLDDTPAVRYMAARAAADPRLVELSEADYLSDKALDWWLSHNPSAMSSARKFEFGAVPAESSLAATFTAAHVEKSAKFECAVVDVRGYTSVVVRSVSSGSYLLAWAVPVCTNRRTQWYLKNYYFENPSTLALIFYKGSSMAKYRINLANRTVARS